MFNELQAAAVRECGEMLTGTGNDYACAVHGGPPRDRKAQGGRAVHPRPGTGLPRVLRRQLPRRVRRRQADRPAASRVADGGERVSSDRAEDPPGQAVPGDLRGDAADDRAAFRAGRGIRILGHGIGLFPHEAPHLNPNWDDVFEVGDVFAVEPAVYADDELQAGIRLENNYLVTESGVELLSDFAMGL